MTRKEVNQLVEAFNDRDITRDVFEANMPPNYQYTIGVKSGKAYGVKRVVKKACPTSGIGRGIGHKKDYDARQRSKRRRESRDYSLKCGVSGVWNTGISSGSDTFEPDAEYQEYHEVSDINKYGYSTSSYVKR